MCKNNLVIVHNYFTCSCINYEMIFMNNNKSYKYELNRD